MWRKRHQRKRKNWRVVKLAQGVLVANHRINRKIIDTSKAYWKAAINAGIEAEREYRRKYQYNRRGNGTWTITNPECRRADI